MRIFIHPTALFRLTVLGVLASRNNFQHGEIQNIVRELSKNTFQIPNSRRVHLSEQTILRWYYRWKAQGIEGLIPAARKDKGTTQLCDKIQEALLLYKKEDPSRSLNTLITLLEKKGTISKGVLSRATVHRFLQQQSLSKRIVASANTIERRAFESAHCGDLWYGDVMHGPSVQTAQGMRKTYLVSLMDDASRMIMHSEFCLGETAIEIQGVLKQALMKRGLPHKLIIDNGAAYRAGTLQEICARLEIRLIYSRPYEPQSKGKLERWHRTFREQFLNELVIEKIANLSDLNARVWAWLDQIYHTRAHQGLQGKSPIERWREDLINVRQLGFFALNIDDHFYHRIERTVRKDGTVSWEGKLFETDFVLADKKVVLVVDPYAKKALYVESVFGERMGPVSPLDKHANLHRKRQRPQAVVEEMMTKKTDNVVELVYEEHQRNFDLSFNFDNNDINEEI